MSCCSGIFRWFRPQVHTRSRRVVTMDEKDVKNLPAEVFAAQSSATGGGPACCGAVDVCVGAVVREVTFACTQIRDRMALAIADRPQGEHVSDCDVMRLF